MTHTEFCQGRTMRWALAWSFYDDVMVPVSLPSATRPLYTKGTSSSASVGFIVSSSCCDASPRQRSRRLNNAPPPSRLLLLPLQSFFIPLEALAPPPQGGVCDFVLFLFYLFWEACRILATPRRCLPTTLRGLLRFVPDGQSYGSSGSETAQNRSNRPHDGVAAAAVASSIVVT